MAHQFACPDCAFLVRSKDDDEIIENVQNHAENAHGRQAAPDDVRAGWEDVEIEASD